MHLPVHDRQMILDRQPPLGLADLHLRLSFRPFQRYLVRPWLTRVLLSLARSPGFSTQTRDRSSRQLRYQLQEVPKNPFPSPRARSRRPVTFAPVLECAAVVSSRYALPYWEPKGAAGKHDTTVHVSTQIVQRTIHRWYRSKSVSSLVELVHDRHESSSCTGTDPHRQTILGVPRTPWLPMLVRPTDVQLSHVGCFSTVPGRSPRQRSGWYRGYAVELHQVWVDVPDIVPRTTLANSTTVDMED